MRILAALLAASTSAAAAPAFNTPGNVLISDQFNNRVLEISPQKNPVWSFGSGNPTLCNPGPGAVIAPNDVERLANGLTLIAGTGTSTCPDNRVIVVDQWGDLIWQYGQAGVSGSGPNQLNVPVFALETPRHTILITDQGNNRIIEVDQQHNIVYQYAPTSGAGALNNPNSAELLRNGHILIADENNSRVLEIDPAHNNRIVLNYSTGLNIVAFASRLRGRATLITDSGNNRIVEIDRTGKPVFTYSTNRGKNSNANPNPSGAVQLANGNILIADQFNDRVLEIDSTKKRVFQYGVTNVPGNSPGYLNAPYSAVVVGDYTGVTPPPPYF